MKLLTEEIIKAFEAQGYTGDKEPEDVKVICKLFNPAGAGTWYGIEYDKENGVLFGYVDLQERELGYFSLQELEDFRDHRFGLGIERDEWFPVAEYTLRQIMDRKYT
jgi:hypothetical protein